MTLAVTALMLAPPALAQVCDVERPDWSIENGPVDMTGEALFHVLSPPWIALAILLIVAFTLRNRWLSLAVGLIALVMVPMMLAGDLTGISAEARLEGCMGPASASATAWGLLAVPGLIGALILRRRRDRGVDGGDDDG